MTEVYGWHFVHASGRLARYVDDASGYDGELVEAGKTYRAKGEIAVCRNGLHACESAIDALDYAPGPIVCRVKLGGKVARDTDKLAARKRTVIAMADATAVLHEFAVWCAERALERERAAGREPDPRSWAALDAKRRWLRGEISDEDLARIASAAARAYAGASDARAGAARASYIAAGVDGYIAARAACRIGVNAIVTDAFSAACTSVYLAVLAAERADQNAERAAHNTELERRLFGLLGMTND